MTSPRVLRPRSVRQQHTGIGCCFAQHRVESPWRHLYLKFTLSNSYINSLLFKIDTYLSCLVNGSSWNAFSPLSQSPLQSQGSVVNVGRWPWPLIISSSVVGTAWAWLMTLLECWANQCWKPSPLSAYLKTLLRATQRRYENEWFYIHNRRDVFVGTRRVVRTFIKLCIQIQ